MTNSYDFFNELFSYNSDPDDLGQSEHIKDIQAVAQETQDKAKNSVTCKTRDNYFNEIQKLLKSCRVQSRQAFT